LADLRAHLDAARASGRGRMIAIRGRRQVGKSAVVERFAELSGLPYAFATGVQGASGRDQLQALASAARQSRVPLLDADALFARAPASWRDAFGALELVARQGPVIVVLDEFPWMAQADPALESVLQAAWDRALEKLPVLLILIGSDVTMMERLASHGRPLFGRLRPLVVEPLNLGEVAELFAGWSAAQVVDAHLVVGGFPRLLTDLAESSSGVEAFVRASLRDPFSPLLATGRLIMDAEFPNPVMAARLLSAIGADDRGHPRFTDLVPEATDPAERKAAETATTRALALLSGPKRLIEQETPAWAPATSRLRRYRVTDPYLRFWFRYVNGWAELVERGRADLAIDHFDRDWTSWRGRAVEPLARQSLLRLAGAREDLREIRQVSPWWSRDGQTEVDAVAMDAARSVLVGTIKWRANQGVTARDMTQLAQALARVPRADGARLAAICRQGRRPAGADLVFTAEDLVGAWR